MTFVYDLHYRLLMGKAGAVVLGIAGLALLLLLITGLIVWWPKGPLAKALRYKADAPPFRRARDQHKLAGLGGLVLLLMLTGTGVMLALPKESDALLSTMTGPADTLPTPRSSRREGRRGQGLRRTPRFYLSAVALQQQWPRMARRPAR